MPPRNGPAALSPGRFAVYDQPMDVLTVTLITLATHRLCVLAIGDRYTRTPRQWLQLRFERAAEEHTGNVTEQEWQSKVAYLLTCYWCMSIWAGGAVTIATSFVTSVPLPVLTWLTASTVTGLLGGPRDE